MKAALKTTATLTAADVAEQLDAHDVHRDGLRALVQVLHDRLMGQSGDATSAHLAGVLLNHVAGDPLASLRERVAA